MTRQELKKHLLELRDILEKKMPKFNPQKDITPQEHRAIGLWQNEANPNDRDDVPGIAGAGRVRALHKLHGITKVRKNPSGEREFLLHRGMSDAEHYKHVTGGRITNDENISSWTTNRKYAKSAAKEFLYDNNYSPHVVSAWIRESDIHHVPAMLGETTVDMEPKPGKNQYRDEEEVLVRPHSSKLASTKDLADIKRPSTNIHNRINDPITRVLHIKNKLGKSNLVKAALSNDSEVASIAVRSGNKILMGQRNDEGHRWTLPGGHLNTGEEHHEGAARELWEETGILVKPEHLKYVGSEDVTTFTGKRKRIHGFIYDHQGETPTTHQDPDREVNEWRWISTNEGQPRNEGLPRYVRDNLHSPRNTVLKHLGLVHYEPEEQTYGLGKSIQDEAELQKTRGRITMPGMSPMTRPDQQVRRIETGQQQKLTAHVMANQLINSSKPLNHPSSPHMVGPFRDKAIQEGIGHLGRGTIRGANFGQEGLNIAVINHLAEHTTAEHEGFHHLAHDIRQRHGEKVAARAMGSLVSHLHPQEHQHISTTLALDGYDPLSRGFNEEIINRTRDILHNPQKRLVAEATAKEMGHPFDIKRLKQSWEKMRNSAKHFKPEQFK